MKANAVSRDASSAPGIVTERTLPVSSGGKGSNSSEPSPLPSLSSVNTLQHSNCSIYTQEDGSAIATVRIPEDILRRLRSRAQNQDLGEYVWQNIVRPALQGHVY